MSAISIAVNIELPMKTVKYLESSNIRHKLSFVDKTMQHITKLGSLMRKINKDQDFIDNKDDQWINFWLNRLNKYNKDYNRKEYDKFINNHKELTIPTHGLFSNTWIKNAKEEYIIIDRAVISNENEGVRLAIDPDTIKTHAKDTFAGILQKHNTKSIEQDVFWSNIYG
ncbi:unnamed protein product [Rhizophagus irregularis]|uniref:Uncharacterized protein n=1 Tax=Rhizophagus irregularis TaxID=588596 RepID=A0A916EK77_9GLOM|nr:unnamed protein product [Rhizophagus irregularis]